MRVAPAVEHPLAHQGLWRLLGSLLGAMTVAVPLVWLGWHWRVAGASARWPALGLGGLAAAAGLLAGGAARRRAARHPGRLRWTGAAWQHVRADGTAEPLARPVVRIDLGVAMLARADGPGRAATWLPLERRDAPSSWHGLRVALAQAPADRPTDTMSGAAA